MNFIDLICVIYIHSDGSVDAVSEYVSSTKVHFGGTTGYANSIGALQTIAQQYSKVGYTINTRMFGYAGQTPTIADTSVFDGSTDPSPQLYISLLPESGIGQEYNGGVLGDTLCLKDHQLVGNIYNNDISTYGDSGLKTYEVGTTTPTVYWVASRHYWQYQNAIKVCLREVNVNGEPKATELRGSLSMWSDSYPGYALRPIITLKSEVTKSGGEGTKSNPYTLN